MPHHTCLELSPRRRRRCVLPTAREPGPSTITLHARDWGFLNCKFCRSLRSGTARIVSICIVPRARRVRVRLSQTRATCILITLRAVKGHTLLHQKNIELNERTQQYAYGGRCGTEALTSDSDSRARAPVRPAAARGPRRRARLTID